MPKAELKPNPSDYKQISEFLESISWGSQCYIIYPLDGTRCCLIVPSKIKPYLVVPCHWLSWETQKSEILQMAQLLHMEPGVLMYGDDCPDYDCDRLNFELIKSGVIVHWNGASNWLNYSRFMSRATDGIDDNWEES